MTELDLRLIAQGEHDVGRLSSTRKRQGSGAHHHHHRDGRATPDSTLNIQSFGGLPEPPSPSFRVTKASGASTVSTVRSGRRSIGAKSVNSLFRGEPSLRSQVPPLPPPPSPSSRSVRQY